MFLFKYYITVVGLDLETSTSIPSDTFFCTNEAKLCQPFTPVGEEDEHRSHL